MLVSAFALYLVAGHGFHAGQTIEDAAMGSGICIVLVAVAGAAALTYPPPARPLTAAAASPRAAARRRSLAPQPSARASPVWLQRFLN